MLNWALLVMKTDCEIFIRFARVRQSLVERPPMDVFRIGAIAMLVLLGALDLRGDEPADAPSAAGKAAEQIAKWIEQLGDSEYATRERAQQELIKRGFEAFDLLSDAQESDDPEIAMQAAYLVRMIRADWTRDTDPRPIQEIFKAYDVQSDDRRIQRIKQLADLPADQGLEWLCRLVRFEKSLVLSKQAALAIIAGPAPADAAAWSKRAATITASVQHARRAGARWLMAYVQSQNDPAGALDKWSALVDAERKTLDDHPQDTSSKIVLDLLRRKIDLLDRLGRSAETHDVMRQMVQCERGDSASLTELVEWLAKRKAWSVIDEVAARFAASFDLDAMLLYTLCEARVAQGNRELADATAEKALKLSGDNPQEHASVVDRLVERGLVEWADRELRQIIALGPVGSVTDVRARRFLADSLHDRRRDREAAEVLKGLLDAADADPMVMQRMRAARQPGEVTISLLRSSMHFYFACDAENQSDSARQRQFLDKALEQDRTNVDVLIALYRASREQPQQRAQFLALIKEVIETCRGQIENAPDEPTFYNQIAWLVANTEGDVDEAIRLSHKSVDLARAEGESPKRVGGLLDTLGHCYFAKKDYANAVKYQTEAATLDPHTASITRQLKVFQEALAAQKGAPQ
jgi:tetratricopeptide (TPR) repeat protein